MPFIRCWLALLLAVLFLASRLPTGVQAATNILRVTSDGANTAGCGGSWATACDLHTALARSAADPANITEIWLKEGLYPTSTTNDANASFNIPANTRIFGGFRGIEITRQERTYNPGEPERYSILTGEGSTPAVKTDNSFHVITIQAVTAARPVVLDRLVVMAGSADGQNINSNGAGLYIENSTVYISNSLIYQNEAKQDGGGLYIIANSAVTLVNDQIISNAAGRYGGGIYANSSTVDMINTLVYSNTSKNDTGNNNGDGAFAGDNSTLTVVNSIFWANPSTQPAIAVPGKDQVVDISYSIIQGGCPVTGCVEVDTTLPVDPFFGTDTASAFGISLPDITILSDVFISPTLVIDDPYDLDGNNDTSSFPYDINGGLITPTAVTLYSFSAAPHEQGILVSWETATEINNLGFRLYRRPLSSAQITVLTLELIPSSAPGDLMGAVYTWFDLANPGQAYEYTLEAIDFDGSRQFATTTYHPPSSAGSFTRRVFLPLIP